MILPSISPQAKDFAHPKIVVTFHYPNLFPNFRFISSKMFNQPNYPPSQNSRPFPVQQYCPPPLQFFYGPFYPSMGIECWHPNQQLNNLNNVSQMVSQISLQNDSSAIAEDEGNSGRKRRVLFPQEVVKILEETYQVNNFINAKKRNELAKKCKLRPDQVKIWFQNRRYKQKKKKKDIEFMAKRAADRGGQLPSIPPPLPSPQPSIGPSLPFNQPMQFGLFSPHSQWHRS